MFGLGATVAAMTAPVPAFRQILLDTAADLVALAEMPASTVARELAARLDHSSNAQVVLRLKAARRAAVQEMKASLGSQYAVARVLGVGESTVTQILRGRPSGR